MRHDDKKQEEGVEEGVPYRDIEEDEEILGSTSKPPINITGKVSDKVYIEKSDD